MEQIRILVVDDHRVMREGLRALLETEKDITVVGEAETGRQAVQLAKQLKPSVVIMDIAMPVLNGLEATRQITRDVPTTKILVLSAYSDGPSVQKAVEAGAAGYLLKETAVADVLTALHELKNGQLFLSPAIPRWIRDECREAQRNGPKSRKPTGPDDTGC
jgi:DNA-binding NarL/FixJ family response regulator